MTTLAHIDDARLQDIEERLELYKSEVRFDTATPGSLNDNFLGRDVPWLIERVRQLGRLLDEGHHLLQRQADASGGQTLVAVDEALASWEQDA